jgi:hypothetical protein
MSCQPFFLTIWQCALMTAAHVPQVNLPVDDSVAFMLSALNLIAQSI